MRATPPAASRGRASGGGNPPLAPRRCDGVPGRTRSAAEALARVAAGDELKETAVPRNFQKENITNIWGDPDALVATRLRGGEMCGTERGKS